MKNKKIFLSIKIKYSKENKRIFYTKFSNIFYRFIFYMIFFENNLILNHYHIWSFSEFDCESWSNWSVETNGILLISVFCAHNCAVALKDACLFLSNDSIACLECLSLSVFVAVQERLSINWARLFAPCCMFMLCCVW